MNSLLRYLHQRRLNKTLEQLAGVQAQITHWEIHKRKHLPDGSLGGIPLCVVEHMEELFAKEAVLKVRKENLEKQLKP